MTLVYPPDLPPPNRDGYRASSADPRLAKAAETGPPGWRRRSSSVARTVSLVVDLTRPQKAIFDTFHEIATASGALAFTMPDPVTDGWPLLTADGVPLLTAAGVPILLGGRWLCLFGAETPSETILRGVRFRKTFNVVVLP